MIYPLFQETITDSEREDEPTLSTLGRKVRPDTRADIGEVHSTGVIVSIRLFTIHAGETRSLQPNTSVCQGSVRQA